MAGTVGEALAPPPMPPARRPGMVGAALGVPGAIPIGRSAGPVPPDLQAQMDNEEAAGAGNWAAKWSEFERMRATADDAAMRYHAGQASAKEAAGIIDIYNDWQEQNRYWLEPKIVNPPRPWWQFWGGK